MPIKLIKPLFILHCSMILICFNDMHALITHFYLSQIAPKLDVNIKKKTN